MEIWKNIEGYEGLYQISNYGNCKSLDRTIERKSRWGNIIKINYIGKFLVPNKVGKGYYRYDLCKNGKYEYFYIHRLVFETFIGKIPDGLEIDHINTDKSDNRLCNLRVVDRKGNMNNPITKGKNHHPCSEETKKKLSESLKGRHNSPNTEFKKGHKK